VADPRRGGKAARLVVFLERLALKQEAPRLLFITQSRWRRSAEAPSLQIDLQQARNLQQARFTPKRWRDYLRAMS
jgi:hypothetical protein